MLLDVLKSNKISMNQVIAFYYDGNDHVLTDKTAKMREELEESGY